MGKRSLLAVQNIDIEIDHNQFVALAGPSGSGKTTLLNLIGLLDEPSEGDLSVLGSPVTKLSADQRTLIRRSKIGFIFQNFNLIPVLNALENVEFSLVHSGLSDEEVRRRSIEALKWVGLGDRVDHRPDELSGGQRQRVACARAIVHRPQLIIADEPTAALDKKTGADIMDLLVRLRQDIGALLIVASHDPVVLARADQVFHIEDGAIQSVETKRGGL